MNTIAETTKIINVQAALRAIDALEPSRQDVQKSAFKEAYPLILKKLKEGIKGSDIIKVLAVQGILKSRNTYIKWMAEMENEVKTGVKGPSAVHVALQHMQDEQG